MMVRQGWPRAVCRAARRVDQAHPVWIHLVEEHKFAALVSPQRRQPREMANRGTIKGRIGGWRR
jgi:hypothetical protein